MIIGKGNRRETTMIKTELMAGMAEHADEPIPNESWSQVTATSQTQTPTTNQGNTCLPSNSTEQQLGSMHLAGKGDSPAGSESDISKPSMAMAMATSYSQVEQAMPGRQNGGNGVQKPLALSETVTLPPVAAQRPLLAMDAPSSSSSEGSTTSRTVRVSLHDCMATYIRVTHC